MPEEILSIPTDLSIIPSAELDDFTARATAEFDQLHALENYSTDDVARMATLTEDIDRLRAETAVRALKAEAQADAKRFKLEQQRISLSRRVHGDNTGTKTTPGEGTLLTAPQVDTDAIAAAAARGATEALVKAFSDRTPGLKSRVSLADAQQHAPAPNVPDAQLAVTASVDIPGVASGSALTFDGVVESFQKRAKALPISTSGSADSGPRVCTIRREYAHTVDHRTSAAAMDELFKRLVNPETIESLVAAGGWCAPSETLYSFFNTSCVDGLVDLPTIGISRGGITWPQARSLATFATATNPWRWTEVDDEDTLTGTGTKPCIRVKCPEYNEQRLECYGICVTSGNLTDDAFPESTADYLRHLMGAHQHFMNMWHLRWMVAQSTGPYNMGDLAAQDMPITTQILGAVSLAGEDYKARLGYCDTTVLEVIIPSWARSMIRQDLAWRFGVDLLAVTDEYIDSMFRVRRIAPQWVGDWQVRGTNQPGNATVQMAWPDEVSFLIYAAGTFVRGNGLTLDLGVVRDSVLNAENDHTAAWTEECTLIALIGQESRMYTVATNVRGWVENTAAAYADRL